MNVKYIVSKKVLPHREVFAGASATVYENSSSLPRVWSVNRVTQAKNLGEAFSMFENPSFDPQKEAILEEELGSFLPSHQSGATISGADDPETLQFEQLSRNRFG